MGGCVCIDTWGDGGNDPCDLHLNLQVGVFVEILWQIMVMYDLYLTLQVGGRVCGDTWGDSGAVCSDFCSLTERHIGPGPGGIVTFLCTTG